MSVIRNAAIALLAAVTLTTSVTAADAGRRERDFVRGAVAGVAGAVIVGAIASERRGGDRYYNERPVYYERPVYREVRYERPVYVQPRYREVRYERPVVVRRAGVDPHVAYCQGRYRSYDVRSDTYQPNHGPRRTCVSPY